MTFELINRNNDEKSIVTLEGIMPISIGNVDLKGIEGRSAIIDISISHRRIHEGKRYGEIDVKAGNSLRYTEHDFDDFQINAIKNTPIGEEIDIDYLLRRQ